MQKFFITKEEFEANSFSKEISFQIKNVLRGRINDECLIGYNDKNYLIRITQINNKDVSFEIIKELEIDNELPIYVSLFQGYPKSDKLESIIKYGTQLGIKEINPVMMMRSIVKIDEGKKKSKLERFNKIATEAAEQSFRNTVPIINDIEKLKNIDFTSYDVKILCYEESAKNNEFKAFKKAIKNLKINDKVAVVVGPEGGITTEEVSYLESLGFICVGLGPRILRTETVIYYILSAISYEWELK